jgi:PadR family transcriptional regulator AphA
MSLRHALLGLLADRPMSGYQLTRAFDGSLAHVWSARHSQIYPELARLRDKGLIDLVDEGPRGRKTYAATPEGIEELRRWMLETDGDRGGRDPAYLRVFFLWLLEPADAAAYVRRLAEHHRTTLARYEAAAAEGSPTTARERAFRVALEAGIRHERALLDWAGWALHELEPSR